MASLSEEELKVIRAHPLGNALDTLIEPLRDVDSLYSSEGADGRYEQIGDRLSNLIHAFLGAKVALNSVRGPAVEVYLLNLLITYERVQNDDFNYAHYWPLVKLVIQKASDTDIWGAVFDLIAKISRATPLPPVAPNVRTSTPFRTNSGSLQAASRLVTRLSSGFFRKSKIARIGMCEDFTRNISRIKTGPIARRKYTNQGGSVILEADGIALVITLRSRKCLTGCSSCKMTFSQKNSVVTTRSTSRESLSVVRHDGRFMLWSRKRTSIPPTMGTTGGTLR
ncbi:hypothetical protein VTN31DRAFT_2225 [Thermomyces dupontii]|uniref:uncharacterized protein n=1 Tax=Talaromyces thermophilus TaxID=28565 RepID=UPI003744788A